MHRSQAGGGGGDVQREQVEVPQMSQVDNLRCFTETCGPIESVFSCPAPRMGGDGGGGGGIEGGEPSSNDSRDGENEQLLQAG